MENFHDLYTVSCLYFCQLRHQNSFSISVFKLLFVISQKVWVDLLRANNVPISRLGAWDTVEKKVDDGLFLVELISAGEVCVKKKNIIYNQWFNRNCEKLNFGFLEIKFKFIYLF